MHAWTLLIVTHVVAALASVLLGVVQLVRRKGDQRHRHLGRVWVVLMVWSAVSSFWIRHLRDGAFSWLHVLSLVTLVTVSLGVWRIRRGDVQGHRGNMVGSWLGSGIAMVFAMAMPDRMLPTFAVDQPLGALAALASVVALVVVLVAVGDLLARRAASLPARAL
ncbi:DUF2306 domain-containing protein [Oryzobacter telluris]|uniref:DUF2306 domain-containing protein n=1 Tax=Oryzobacter telluris TaxID=3149179 RepID=UPI00370D735B